MLIGIADFLCIVRFSSISNLKLKYQADVSAGPENPSPLSFPLPLFDSEDIPTSELG